MSPTIVIVFFPLSVFTVGLEFITVDDRYHN